MWAIAVNILGIATIFLFRRTTGDTVLSRAAGLYIIKAVASGALQKPLFRLGRP
jgi:hypothetical protein